MNIAAIIVAAGAGRRFGGTTPKQFVKLGGRPLMAWALAAFQQVKSVQEISLVVPARRIGWVREHIPRWGFSKVRHVAPGGRTRTDSVAAGLAALSPEAQLIAIHDGARPLIDQATIQRCLIAGRRWGTAIAAVPVTDTIKVVHTGIITETPPRDRLWLAQTPQVFRRDLLERALAARPRHLHPTDDAQLVERLNAPVRVVLGSEENIKITTPHDLERAHLILQHRRRCSLQCV
ncbi:MAG: 2-C-methyl-D-erythritol 4-phosphate cytidylyltransferase [Elusimicrobia bacterium]|nr:2-C-methyl-D-erythritol 4-phosphate cytidylyltransferase [Elusimicrobiota bacterium]